MVDILDIDLDGIEELVGCKITGHQDLPPFRIYRLEWDNGDWASIYRNGTWLHWDWLQTDKSGTFADLMGAYQFFADRGISHHSSNLGGSDEALLRSGFEHESGYLLYDIEKGRFPEYQAWKRGEAAEPEWHQDVVRQKDD